jgi:hypothetical protein
MQKAFTQAYQGCYSPDKPEGHILLLWADKSVASNLHVVCLHRIGGNAPSRRRIVIVAIAIVVTIAEIGGGRSRIQNMP